MALAVLQARMSSSRLPGKVMRPLLGVPMIGRQVERLRRSRELTQLAVATSDHADDDELAAYCATLGVTVFRGSLNDVLDRFRRAVETCDPSDTVVRLTADCPLVDWTILDEVIRTHRAGGFDYTHNTAVRTFPHGLDVEAVKSEVLTTAWREAVEPYDREHVTPFIYRRPDRFRIGSVTTRGENRAHLRWTVDHPADFDFVAEVYETLYPGKPDFLSDDIAALPRNSAPIPG